MNEQYGLAELANFLVAGHMPLAAALAWALRLLAGHPKVQEKLWQELLEAGLVEEPAAMDYLHMGKSCMDFIHACLLKHKQ